jgi:hypothetical protein
MIIGSQHTPWLLEHTLPLFAKAIDAAANAHPATSAGLHDPEMMEVIDRAQSQAAR